MSDAATPAPGLVKCLVWDLDNTLWKGTLLEGGGTELAAPVRTVIEQLDARGILQSVASKNDHDPAWERLTELGVADYFVHPQIGWGTKSAAVRAIAERLNFATGTLAFIDDQPAERAEVAYHLPEVRCYPAEDVAGLLGLAEFSPATVTVDARNRRLMYQASFVREAHRADHTGPDEDFLRTLELDLRIGRAGDEEISRVEELTLRTSQMNATGVHYSDATLRGLLTDPDHEVLVVTLTDRFGPHGAVGILLLRRHASVWRLKLLATSCRVVSFGVGSALLGWLGNEAAAAGVHLAADFRRTERNRMMEIAYGFAGFTETPCPCLAELGSTGTDGIRHLHLEPRIQPLPSTLRLTAPGFALGRV
ncbi:HAD-IIIC family phosphatase [Actinoplanes sp. GCM10030250]|uniref:HAD-IIIC family phosphatase n=1 Tax=Actinoplanes sp. GCM10030250 TaxID=3273376 RepID=UPI003609A46F